MYIGQPLQPNFPIPMGRERLLDEIAQGVLAPEPLSFSLVGAKSVGKSTALRFLASEQGPLRSQNKASECSRDFQAPEQTIVTFIDCTWQIAGSDLLAQVYRTLAPQLRVTQSELDWKTIDEQINSARCLWQLAHQLNQRQHRLVLLLDNFAALLTPTTIEMPSLNVLRLLMTEAALVVTTDQPLYDIMSNLDSHLDSRLIASSMVDAFIPRFLGLLEPEAADHWLTSYQAYFPGLPTIQAALAEISGRHPFLLRKLGDCLAEVQQMLPPQQPMGDDQLALLHLRLAEHTRPLLMTLWQNLQNPPAYITPSSVMVLIEQLMLAPLATKQVDPDQFSTLNWLINQAIVIYRVGNGVAGYQLFSPLFAEFIRSKLSITPTKHPALLMPISSGALEAPIYEQLTKMEAALLRYFLNHSQSVVSTDQLLTEVWKRPDSSTRRVQEAIRRLRLQLEQQTPSIGIIENERGRGYRFIPA